jgi:putative FmdB family regulatory protein
MPVYEYICEDCNGKFDARVATWREADSVNCRLCNSSHVRRVISTFAFVGNGRALSTESSAARPSSGGCCGGSCGCHR